ncbi:MAG: disulfide bond formation protein B [Gammaproteobacteria bacterium]
MTRRQLNLAGAAACAGMMGCALFFQHGLGLEPCPLCVLQRVATISLGLVFLLAAVLNPARLGSRILGILMLIVAGLGASVSARQVWLQNLPPDQVPACGPGLDYMLEVFPLGDALAMVFEGSGECAEVVWRFLGLSMPAWVLICLLSLGLVGLIGNWRLHGRLREQSRTAPAG